MNLIELLPRTDAVAILDGRRRITFGQLDAMTAQFAADLRAAGLRAGDPALILQPVTAELYIALLGVLRLGAVAMFLDPSAGRQHIEQCCALQPPRALLGSRRAMWMRWGCPSLRQIPMCRVIKMPVAARTPLLQNVENDAPALLTFTSGSTGQPKAALRTHGFLLAQHRALADALQLTPGTTDLATLPVFVLSNLASGVASLLPDADLRRPGQIDPAPVIAQIEQHRPVSTVASPAFLERIADHCRGRGVKLTSFRKIFTGGAPVFPGLLDKLQAIAPQAELVAVYGSTEAEPMAHVTRQEINESSGRGLLAGRPVPQIELRVVRDEWGQPKHDATPLPVNEPGEIVVAGDHVLPGYLRGQGDAETKFDAQDRRWHRTGDAGYIDERGRLWLLGRCAAKVVDAHGTLYPFAVECAAQPWRTALVSHQGRRALVVEPCAPADLKERLQWAQIEEVRVVRHIPLDKRHNAKVDYPALRRLLDNSEETT
jgi:acyl-CoA synthetase (AMP-forming)/AMP-acid ligase II